MKKIYTCILLTLIFSFITTLLHAQPLFLTGASTDPTCDGASNGSITITATGGLQPYTYSIDGITFQNSNVFTGLAAGSYSIFVQDANFDITENNTLINLGPPLTAIVTPTPTPCQYGWAGSITINSSTATAPYTFTLNAFTPNPTVTSIPESFTLLPEGVYTITIADALGCTGSVTTTVVDGPPIQATYTITPASCHGADDGIIYMNFSGGIAPWTVFSLPGGAVVLNYYAQGGGSGVDTAGTFSMLIQDPQGCEGTFTLVIPDQPVATTTVNNDTAVCANNPVQLHGTGTSPANIYGTLFEWSPSTGLSDPTIADPVATPAVTTTYTLTTRTDWSIPTCVSSNEVTITVDNLQAPTIQNNNGTVVIDNPIAGIHYNWQVLNGNIWQDVDPSATGTSYTVTSQGNYRVKASSGGCEKYSDGLEVSPLSSRNPFGIAIYPNPASNMLTINDLKLEDSWQTLEIISYNGSRALPVNNIRNKTSVTVNISSLNSGVYIGRLIKGDGRTVELRFIKE